MHISTLIKWGFLVFISLILTNCGGGGSSNTTVSTTTAKDDTTTVIYSEEEKNASKNDEFSRSAYKGLTFYYKNKPSSDYMLRQLSNSQFNALTNSQKLQVADKILTTFFFGYPLKVLEQKINSGHFIDDIKNGLSTDRTDKEWLENYILDETKFEQYSIYSQPQAITILSRFYTMKELDTYFFNNWVAYILTQTIMFSPAYELSTTHTPNISNVYNRLVTMLGIGSGMRYITYVHMMSEDNWRRFRSPEDNGREMLEIYLFDQNDLDVPIAGKALQNWKLNTDSDTLEVSLNRNTKPLKLFGTTIYNGDDFYRELVKSDLFVKGVSRRIVDFFFPQKSDAKRAQITDTIVSSHPETWQDILLQIVFSEEYLLHNQRAKSAEETFFSLAKKMDYKHRKNTFASLKNHLEEMHQATMKYKLGKVERVPLDTLSFAYYHKFIRNEILLKRSHPDKINDYNSWARQGWSESFLSFNNFDHESNSDGENLDLFVDYLFKSTIARSATDEEKTLFRNHMTEEKNGKKIFRYEFNMFVTYDDQDKQKKQRKERKINIALIVLDYISRLDTTYLQKEVQ